MVVGPLVLLARRRQQISLDLRPLLAPPLQERPWVQVQPSSREPPSLQELLSWLQPFSLEPSSQEQPS